MNATVLSLRILVFHESVDCYYRSSKSSILEKAKAKLKGFGDMESGVFHGCLDLYVAKRHYRDWRLQRHSCYLNPGPRLMREVRA